jgi:hypothetical protein
MSEAFIHGPMDRTELIFANVTFLLSKRKDACATNESSKKNFFSTSIEFF